MKVLLIALAAAAIAPAQRYATSETTENSIRYIVLRDAKLGREAWIAPEKGGELAGFRVTFKGKPIELIYRARDYSPTKGWTGRAPLLWPAVARNFAKGVRPDGNAVDCSYDWKGRRYEIPIHGFVRNMPWKVERAWATDAGANVVLSVRDTAETRRAYPFAFQLQAHYTLARNRLHIDWSVKAGQSNSEPMFFSIGNHITFRTPFVAGGRAADMTFESPSTVEYTKDASTLPDGKEQPRSFADPVKLADLKTIPAISLGGYRGKPSVILRDPAGLAVTLDHFAQTWPAPPVVQFNIWGDAEAGYFSPEPWVGIQNSLNSRKGLVTLAPGALWNWIVTITVP